MGRTFSITVYPDYYTSKVYPKGQMKMFHDPKKAVAHGVENLARHYQDTGLSLVYRSLLDACVKEDVPIISYCTWNDYQEGHHLAPEINHNFAPAILLNYYKKVWKKEPNPIDKDTILVFYKKYPAKCKPSHFNIHIHTKESTGIEGAEEGVEIVTLLTAPGEVFYNGKKVGEARKGMTVLKAAAEIGRVKVEVKRGGRTVTSVSPPEWITDKPYRTDRLTYMYTNRFAEYYSKLFDPKTKPPVSDEYAEDGEGQPNWKKRYGL